MKGESDNKALNKIKSKGNQSELKKPLQVLQLNKKQSIKDKSKNSSTNAKLTTKTDLSNSIESNKDM